MIEKLVNSLLFETAINRALSLDPRVAEKLAPLEGRRISVKLDFIERPWVFKIQSERLTFSQADSEQADVRLNGTIGGFLRLFRHSDQAPGANDKLYIEGDLHTAQQFQRVMGELSPDFRFILEKRFGERLGGILSDGLNQMREQGERAREALEARLRRFVSEEGCLVRDSFAEFSARIAQLQTRLSQLEMRLNRLETP